MLETMLTNYVSNALDHVEGDKRIEISVEDGESNLAIHVFNTGKAIPEDELDKIWDSFYKIDKARTRAYGGTGLGLAIVKNMVEIHKGSYGLKNIDGGVDFFVLLPKSESTDKKLAE
jgi:signal transduction histidine kinase